jgi:hypothetical protein
MFWRMNNHHCALLSHEQVDTYAAILGCRAHQLAEKRVELLIIAWSPGRMLPPRADVSNTPAVDDLIVFVR